MITKRVIKKLRDSQVVERNELNVKLQRAKDDARTKYHSLPFDYSLADYTVVMHDINTRIKQYQDRLDFLNTELLEHKFANKHLYSDVVPFEVIEELTPKKYLIRQLSCELTSNGRNTLKESFVPGGFVGNTDNEKQEWEINSNENNTVTVIRRHSDGNWYDCGGAMYSISDRPIKKYDFNF